MFYQQPIQFTWDWQLKSQPRDIWPLITDTNRLFKDIKQPSIQQAYVTQADDPEFVQLSHNGINRYEVWKEEPYEWEYPYRFGVKRYYHSGPYKKLEIQVDLHPNERGTRLQIEFRINPRVNFLSFLAVLNLKTLLKNRIKKTVRGYDKMAFCGYKLYRANSEKRLVRGGHKRIQQIKEDLGERQLNTGILEKLIEFICHADDLELHRIRPYELADHWGYSRKEVLEVFLHTTKADLLNFNWDLHCPRCRTIQGTVQTLNQVHGAIYCDECERDFDINFNKNIQLCFIPHPLVRKLSNSKYCFRGPQTKSHVFLQQYLESGEKKYLKTKLPPGTYVLRTNRSEGVATVYVRENGENTVHIDFQSQGLSGEEVDIALDPNLSFTNSSFQTQLITLEQKSWADTGVSAAVVTSLQLFRDLFNDEVLSKGEKISADNLTLMFTDLIDSTGMYNEEGDDIAVGQVINHFEILEQVVAVENGAIVKTIGDSVMAVFCEPEQAFKAYLRAQKMLNEDNRFDDFQLKAGIHHGSCVAVNINSRIDYFGSTVNIASRFVDYASENEVIIPQNALSENKLNQILEEYSKSGNIKDLSVNLKGFDEDALVRSVTIDDSLLRLAI